MIKIKRIYEGSEKNDGVRILVDRLWPRGLTKEKAKINRWMKEIAPSDILRKWFAHRPEHWEEFVQRYRKELKNKKDVFNELKEISKKNTVTLLYAAKDEERNNAKALSDFLKKK